MHSLAFFAVQIFWSTKEEFINPPALTTPRLPSKFQTRFFVLYQNLGSRISVHDRTEIGKRVQIPRCRATVSEEIAIGHWE
jgi:hypothetical protein